MSALGPTLDDPLDRAAEVQLVLKAQIGPGRARDRLVKRYTSLIGSVAKVYAHRHNVDHAELMQEGVVGLLRALRRYDPEFRTSFWAYASWWVLRAMQQLVSELEGPIVLPDRALRQLSRLRAAERRLTQKHGHEPTPRELATATGFSLEQVECLTLASRRPCALEERDGNGDDSMALGDRLADPRAEDAFEMVPLHIASDGLPKLLDVLDDRERGIVRDRFGLNGRELTLRELADAFGVSAERVRQIEEESLDKCRCAALQAS